MKKKKILIFGLNSFGGSCFANHLLNKNYDIVGLYHNDKNKINKIYEYNKNKKNLSKIKVDFNSDKSTQIIKKILQKNKFSHVIDFASICMVDYSWQNPNYYFKINVESKIKILEELKKYKLKYILVSTPEVFGNNNSIIYEDNDLQQPSTPYALTKSYQERYLGMMCKKYNINFNICRFSNFYGPGQATYRLIPRIIYSILFNKKIIIQGKGSAIRSFIYTDDFCDGIFRMMKKKESEKIYHFSNKDFLKVFDVYKTICKLMNVSYKDYFIYGDNRIHEDPCYRLNCKNSIKKLNWIPKHNIEYGLIKTIKFYENKKNEFKKTLLNFEKSKYL